MSDRAPPSLPDATADVTTDANRFADMEALGGLAAMAVDVLQFFGSRTVGGTDNSLDAKRCCTEFHSANPVQATVFLPTFWLSPSASHSGWTGSYHIVPAVWGRRP